MLQYDRRAEYYKRTDVEPPIRLEELILYRSNNRANCLAVEYYLQHHLQNGLWKEHFAGKVNPHRPAPPIKKDHEVRPCYVNARYSKLLSTWQVVDKSMESENKQPVARKPTARKQANVKQKCKPVATTTTLPAAASASKPAACKPAIEARDESPIKGPQKRRPSELNRDSLTTRLSSAPRSGRLESWTAIPKTTTSSRLAMMTTNCLLPTTHHFR
jgi:hypothetical protein